MPTSESRSAAIRPFAVSAAAASVASRRAALSALKGGLRFVTCTFGRPHRLAGVAASPVEARDRRQPVEHRSAGPFAARRAASLSAVTSAVGVGQQTRHNGLLAHLLVLVHGRGRTVAAPVRWQRRPRCTVLPPPLRLPVLHDGPPAPRPRRPRRRTRQRARANPPPTPARRRPGRPVPGRRCSPHR